MDPTVGVKFDENKPKFSLIKHDALLEMVDVLTYGAKKYSPDNWKHLPNARQRYFDAANRHMWQWFGGEERDQESGLHHLAHAMSSLMFLIQMDMDEKEEVVTPARQRDWVEELDKQTTKVTVHNVSKGSHEDWVFEAEPHGY